MTTATDVFSACCTFWTDDWAWLRERNGAGSLRNSADTAISRPGWLRTMAQPVIPYCPFCGSVGFEHDKQEWWRQAQEWEDGTSPNAIGIRHPGYVAMLMWGRNRCFRDWASLEAAWRAGVKP